MAYICMSYSRDDLAYANKIVSAVAEKNVETWIDWKSIRKGEIWWQRMEPGVESATVFLFLASSKSGMSKIYLGEKTKACREVDQINKTLSEL